MSDSKIKSYIKDNKLLIILFAAVSLIEVFLVFPIMLDDYINYDSSYQYGLTQHTLSEIWRLLPYDYSPPFYAIALKLHTLIWGNSLTVMRMFSAFAVVGMYFIAAFPVREIFGKKSAAVTLLLVFFSPAVYGLLHEIRPTIFGMFFFMAAAVYMLYAYSLDRKHGYVCATVFTILAMYTHNIAMVGAFGVFVTVLLFSLVTKNYKKFKNFLICGIICAASYIPWLGVILGQVSSVKEAFWTSTYGIKESLSWIFWEMLYDNGLDVSLKMLIALVFFVAALRHIKLKELKNAKKFGDVFSLADDKKTYRDILLLILFIAVPFIVLEGVNLFVRNLASQRYYYILGMVWPVLLGAIVGRFGKNILAVLLLLVLGYNYLHLCSGTIKDLEQSNMKNIVSDLHELGYSDENIAFLHMHEWTIGQMSYYFPNATHYVCDQTFTVLQDYSVFPVNIVEIGDISNIRNYTDKVFIFTNEWKFNSSIPWYTFEQLMEDEEDVEITDVNEYIIAYNVAAKRMDLAAASWEDHQE